MQHIGSFLLRHKKTVEEKGLVSEKVLGVFNQHIKSKIGKQQLVIKGAKIFLKVSPIVRTELNLHRSQILSELKSDKSLPRIEDFS